MNSMRAKLLGRRGASFIIALTVVLLCSLVGAAILAAAATNAGRLSGERESGQNALAVSSAARLMTAKLTAGGANSLTVSANGGTLTFAAPSSANDRMLRLLYEPAARLKLSEDGIFTCVFSNYKGFEGSSAEPTGISGFLALTGEVTVSPESGLGDSFPDVSVSYTMASDYTLTCTLTAGSGSARQSLRLVMGAAVASSETSSVITWSGPVVSGEAA